LIKVFGIGFLGRGVGLCDAKAQARERKPSKAWAMKMPALNKPRNAVTVSIIANRPLRPARTERYATAHSQKDSARHLIIATD
jgi:hypothetical protein